MSYAFETTAPMDVELFTTASQRQPAANAFHRAYLPMQAYSLLLMLFIILGAGAVGAFLISWLNVSSPVLKIIATLAPFGVAACAWFGFMKTMIRGMYRRMLDSPLYDGPVRYDISEKGYLIASDNALWSVDWSAMDKVTRHPSGIFLYAGGFIYAIPKDVAPEDQYDAMWADIKRWFEAAQ